jgi:hypothetical protein
MSGPSFKQPRAPLAVPVPVLLCSRCRGFCFSLDHATVGRTPLDEGSARRRDLYLTTQTLYKKNIHVPCGIRTRDPSKRSAADLRLRRRGRWDRRTQTPHSLISAVCAPSLISIRTKAEVVTRTDMPTACLQTASWGAAQFVQHSRLYCIFKWIRKRRTRHLAYGTRKIQNFVEEIWRKGPTWKT